MINESDKCFTVSWPEIALSFNDAQDICSAQNASMFTVEVTFPRAEVIHLKKMIISGMLEELGKVPEYLYLIRAETLSYILSGKGLSQEAPQNYLPGMISALSLEYSKSLKFVELDFYVNLNRTCGVTHSSLITSMIIKNKTAFD